MTYEGHKVITTNGYYDVYFPTHPNARKNGSIMLHILIAEKILGRHLNKNEVVHHKDCNRKNNNIENLMIFATQSDHVTYHLMMKSNSPECFSLKKINNVYYCENKENKNKQYRCDNCGKLISMNITSLCRRCYKKTTRKAKRPVREELKSIIRTTPFVQIGFKYGVTDNAIRKWCIQYNLPSKASDIKKISDRDWEKI